MNVSNRIVKITAKTALKDNFLNSLFSCIPLIFTFFLGAYSSFLLNIILGDIFANIYLLLFTFFITLPLFFGVLRYFWRLLNSAKDNPIIVFYYFSKKNLYLKTIKLLFSLFLRLLPTIIILIIPIIFVWLISSGAFFDIFDMNIPIWSANLKYLVSIFSVLSVIILIAVSLKFYIAPLLFVADEEIDIAEAIHMSTVISKKTALDFYYLILSFLGWIFLSLLCIPLVFTLPYIISAYTVHIRFAIAEYNNHIKSSSVNFSNFDTIF